MIDLKAAKILDQQDGLNSFRNRFYHGEGEIYLDGNSLGKLPKNVPEQLDNVIKTQWGKQLIRSWNENWLELPETRQRTVGRTTCVNYCVVLLRV